MESIIAKRAQFKGFEERSLNALIESVSKWKSSLAWNIKIIDVQYRVCMDEHRDSYSAVVIYATDGIE